jgi:hypothetical protein
VLVVPRAFDWSILLCTARSQILSMHGFVKLHRQHKVILRVSSFALWISLLFA